MARAIQWSSMYWRIMFRSKVRTSATANKADAAARPIRRKTLGAGRQGPSSGCNLPSSPYRGIIAPQPLPAVVQVSAPVAATLGVVQRLPANCRMTSSRSVHDHWIKRFEPEHVGSSHPRCCTCGQNMPERSTSYITPADPLETSQPHLQDLHSPLRQRPRVSEPMSVNLRVVQDALNFGKVRH